MMALRLLSILPVIAILCWPSANGIPVYGTKRYGRSSAVHRASNPAWAGKPYQQMVRTQRYPLSYYEMYPYGQSYPDDYYYPQESLSYPVYYPARTSKYEVYQAVLPYYYNERPIMRPGYGYYGYGDSSDPVVDLEEEMLQETEREEREDAQPIGQEMFYENDSASGEDDFDDVNAAFLQNLIMSQLYSDAVDQKDKNAQSDNYYSDDVYGKWEEYPVEPKPKYYQEDEDVRELKQLARPHKHNKHFGGKKPTAEERQRWFERNAEEENPSRYESEHPSWKNWDNKRDGVETISTTPKPPAERQGQKEEVLMRPATPVRRLSPIVGKMWKDDGAERKRVPSVYDTIKHMLDMEKNLENNYAAGQDVKPPMRKRIISSEDSLTQQLSVLKKTQ